MYDVCTLNLKYTVHTAEYSEVVSLLATLHTLAVEEEVEEEREV
jgi:hypothetical protein